MLHYILQTIAFQLFFLIIYDAFLRKETFFNWNRTYLLATATLSVVLPFIQIQSFKNVVPKEFIIAMPEVTVGNLQETNATVITETLANETSKLQFSWELLFYLGASVALIIFVVKLIKIINLIYKNPKHWNKNLRIVTLLKSNTAFSFFYYVFLGEHIKEEDKPTVLKHEAVHVNQKHTFDLLLFEIFRIIFWFNPLIYMYQSRISSLHEFIADAEAVKSQNKNEYYQDLLSQIFETENVSFINAFYKKSLIKKRIAMLSKAKSKQKQLIKYALLIPLVFGMLLYTSSNAQDNSKVVNEIENDATDELGDKELQDKYYVEMLELYTNGDTAGIFKDSKSIKEKYLNTREEFYRFQANMKVLFDKTGHTYSGDKNELKEKLNKSYADYLEFKKTDQAKEIWENNTSDGTLKMVVNELGNLTDKEEKRHESLVQLLIRDDYFHSLVVSDGLGFVKSTVDDHRPKTTKAKVKKPNENKTNNVELGQDPIEVPFAKIDEVPTLSGCDESSNNDEKKKCVATAISKHVQQNFNTKLAENKNLVGKQRINVIFKIDTNGNVFGVRARAPHKMLEDEAIRVIKTLPQFTPGKQKGEKVVVPYSLPIVFQVETSKTSNDEKTNTIPTKNGKELKKAKNKSELKEVPFAVIDEFPILPSCQDLTTQEERKKCVVNAVSKHVVENFNVKLAKELKLTGQQRINVMFKINKEGNVFGVRSRAPHRDLETEAIRVINLLPKFIPGKHKGKNVIVPYSLPIIFEVKDDRTPFAKVDKVPTMAECQSLPSNKEQRDCVANAISKFVQKNFNADLPSKLGLKGKQRIMSKFTINNQGEVVDIVVKAPHVELEAEAERTLKLLPKFIPGEHEGKKVNVSYALPIVFMVQ